MLPGAFTAFMAVGALNISAQADEKGCTPVVRVVKNALGFLLPMEGMVSGNSQRARALNGAVAGAIAVLFAGCAGNTGNGDPGPQALSGGETCQSIRSNLTRLDKEGVQSLVERQTSGQKLSPAQKAKADLYNQLLDKYLGARCHV
ncbi:MAG TPA: hypothetical protein VFF87_11445 [Hyphomicrobium sp.]|nr:hypothetical protein [Hyphomicrobium sp.]